jgi:hypothetical protein
MVARLSEMPAPWALEFATAPANDRQFAAPSAPRLAMRGQLLLERATSMADVRIGNRVIPDFGGVPLHLEASACTNTENVFLRDRVFATVSNDGSLCLRLPADISAELIDNGLCVAAGKNLLTWQVESAYQLEVNWRILLLTYWHATGTSGKRARRLWSEFAIKH